MVMDRADRHAGPVHLAVSRRPQRTADGVGHHRGLFAAHVMAGCDIAVRALAALCRLRAGRRQARPAWAWPPRSVRLTVLARWTCISPI